MNINKFFIFIFSNCNNINLNENKHEFEEKEEKKNDLINEIIEENNFFIISEKIEKIYNNQINKIYYTTAPFEIIISEDFHKNSYLINDLINITNELNQKYKNNFRYIHMIVVAPNGKNRTIMLNYNDLLNGNFKATYDLIEKTIIFWVDQYGEKGEENIINEKYTLIGIEVAFINHNRVGGCNTNTKDFKKYEKSNINKYVNDIENSKGKFAFKVINHKSKNNNCGLVEKMEMN